MKSVLVRLEGPLQSWGTQGRFGIRDTDREPSKSGVLGLIGAALGMPREDDTRLAQLAGMSMAVRVDREGKLLDDYHTVGAGTFRGEPHSLYSKKDPAITIRGYLADASFLVGLGSDDVALVSEVAQALQAPTWAPFLGRRSCSPSAPLFAGVVEGDPASALRHAEWSGRPETRVRLLVEADSGAPRMDVPLSFASHARKHRRRFVRTEWIVREAEAVR